MRKRLLTLAEVAEILNVSWAQAYALVRSRDLPGTQIGGRKQWRVDPDRLQNWLDECHRKTAEAGRTADTAEDTAEESAATGAEETPPPEQP